MGVEIIVHRGHRDFVDNTLMGIVTALSEGRICEFDVFYIQNQWVICHDVCAYHRKASPLQELLHLLHEHPHFWKNAMMIDIKWDFTLHHDEELVPAIHQLWEMLSPFSKYPIWLQAGCDMVLSEILVLRNLRSCTWRIGKIIRSVDESVRLQGIMEFATIDLSLFSKSEIMPMREHYFIIGYTCSSMQNLRQYLQYNHVIDALVCDLSISEDKYIRKNKKHFVNMKTRPTTNEK